MIVYALSDPHLSSSVDKPMNVFGRQWEGHPEKMFEAWRRCVKPGDLVLVPGDISWAMKASEAQPDLEALDALPGFKLVTKGNHDYWWPSKKRDFTWPGLKSLRFLHGRTFRAGPLGIAATRGWKIPGDSWFTGDDRKIYEKELRFLEQSLPALGDASIRLCMLHYPPFNDRKQAGDFIPLLEKYAVQHVIFGHLHSPGCEDTTVTGTFRGIEYHLTSCDMVGFTPVPIVTLPAEVDFLQGVALFESAG